MEPQEVDTVVVGAGLSGIAAARFYLEIHPECRLVILEQDSCLGGVWNSRRSYEGFWTQWTIGSAEFSDMRMNRPPEEDVYYEFFKAKHTTQYLEEYTDRHSFAGQTLRERIRFGFTVQTITKLDGTWVVSGEDMTNTTISFHAQKVIVASGLTSTPNLPEILGKENFEAPVIHQENFGQSSVLSAAHIQNVTVLGGGKSAADMVYASVKAGKSVTWVIRASGTGPGFLFSPKGKGPYKNAFELGSTRGASTLSPSIFNPDNWWTRFLHTTEWGGKLVNSIWIGADKETREIADFDGRKGALKGFRNLKPLAPIFWQNGTGGLLNRADFWETIAPNVHIYHDDILKLEKRLVRLKRGDQIPTDVLLCGTGWHPSSFGFFSPELAVKLGLPHPFQNEPAEDAETWTQLEKEADQRVLQEFPQLVNPPNHPSKPVSTTPYRLYNGIAPLDDDSIAFIGCVSCANYFRGVECQAIWATAFLDKQLTLPSKQDQQEDIARMNAWCRRRYLSNGVRGNFLSVESTGYTDKLLREIGLSSHLKGWFRDYFVPGTSQDLVGLKDEYMTKYGHDRRKSGKGVHAV